ncbi:FlxA-like family protein [Symbiopectobacterium purcellii]|uniref:FlxA-like family protein n=1 Tax=Symbiopectobacterium purcellii TaxID=2871826 RepID=A0ABX9AQX8_9ENTR|nr:FlxA-like family protein [Symbiopectobacterium purcellii]QZN96180.1 FlxA-like family protein [Symbiopectobacterium purcellii]
MRVSPGSMTSGMLKTLATQVPSSGNSVEQKIQKLHKQIVKLVKALKELTGKAAGTESDEERNALRKQIQLIQQQIQALYAEISRLQRQDAEKSSTASAATTTPKADLSQEGTRRRGHQINIYA